MTAAATQSTPAIPPRPSRASEKDSSSSSGPKIPPRPIKSRAERSISPNAQRFAQSPFNEGRFPRPDNKALLSPNRGLYEPVEDPIDRPGSVSMPGVGEEGMEYNAIASEAEDDKETRAVSPEQTRTVGEGLELHAPRATLPANSAKARVQTVTRTDSDRAAQFGIGRPTSAGGSGRPTSRQSVGDRATSREGVKNRPSTSFSNNSDHGHQDDDDHGIPEIGQRVPMNPNLGDVQAPSPGPENNKRNHVRKHSARGLPPGSYGLHGHGVGPQDKLEKAYYQKHPELLHREEHTPIHDRQNTFAMSREDLNRLVRDTASRGAGLGTAPEIRSTPTDEVAFQASEEYVRQTSPRPGSAQPKDAHRRSSSLAKVQSHEDIEDQHEDRPIHVDDARHPEYRSYGDEEAAVDDEEHEYHAPILASDEVLKNPSAYYRRPAVHPLPNAALAITKRKTRPAAL